jgi:predicted RNA-binding protein with PIN domain
MHIIVDGYNLIRQSDSLRRFERIGLEEGRKELVRRLVKYKNLKKHRITVVFDGWIGGSFQEERQREEGIDIIFSRRGVTADEVIKKLAKRESGDELVVVTSDRGITDSIIRAGGVAISSPEFETRVKVEEEAAHLDKGSYDAEEDEEEITMKSRKKGPSRRISKKKRVEQRRLKKL